MTTQREELRIAADIIASFLASTLSREERQKYAWERDGLAWLSRQWKRDPDTLINMWTADKVREWERERAKR